MNSKQELTGTAIPLWSEAYGKEDEPIVGVVRLDPSYYPFMLIQDIQDRLFPSRRGRHGKNLSLAVSPPNSDFEAALVTALKSDARPHDFEYAIDQFLQMAVYDIVSYNRAIYSLDLSKIVGSGSEKRFRFIPVIPATVTIRNGKWFQYLPRQIQRERGFPQYWQLDPKRLLILKVEPGIDLPRIVESLNRLPQIMPTKMRGAIDPIGGDAIYDWTVHRAYQNEAFLVVTRQLGWMARNLHATDLAAPYQAIRWLRFLEFIASLRRSMVGAINLALTFAKESFGVEARIEMSGFPEMSEYSHAKTEILRGATSIKKILARFDAS